MRARAGGESTSHMDMWQHLALTLMQQSHLCPLPLLHQPIFWQHDHALSLYPLPHAVVAADMSPQATYEDPRYDCRVFTPVRVYRDGDVGGEGMWVACLPARQGLYAGACAPQRTAMGCGKGMWVARRQPDCRVLTPARASPLWWTRAG